MSLKFHTWRDARDFIVHHPHAQKRGSTGPMNIALWILQGLLALVFLAAGASKLFQPIPKLAKQMSWTGQVPVGLVRFIGLAELLGAIGLILPGVTHIAPALTAAAGIGLIIAMLAAVIFHIVRNEGPNVAGPIVLALLLLFITYGRLALVPLV